MKTKTLFGMTLMAALWLSACTSDETLENITENSPVEFGTYVGKDAQTRGAVADLDMLRTRYDFGVFAYYTKSDFAGTNNTQIPNFMYNQSVRWSAGDGKWGYTPLKYWPNNEGDRISFFAYAPHSKATDFQGRVTPSDNNAGGNPTVSFEVKTKAAEQLDLLVAEPKLNQTKPAVGAKTTFTFKHALSRVGFKAVAMFDQVNGDVNGSTPDDAAHSTYGIDGSTNIKLTKIELKGNFATKGTIDLNTHQWSALTNQPVTYTLEGSDVNNLIYIDHTSIKRVNTDNAYLMLIPTNQQITITAHYTVSTTDPSVVGHVVVNNTVTSEPFTVNFEAGKAYDFVLHLGMTSAKFDVATITDWTPADYVANTPNNN